MWIGERRQTATGNKRWGMKAATSAVKAGPWRGPKWSLRGWGNLHPIWGKAAHGAQRERAEISNESCRSNGTDWTPTSKWIIRKVKADKENERHELASYDCVNPFIVTHKIVGQILKETLIKGTEKNEIKCNTGLPKAVCARLCWHLPLIR